MNLGSSLWTAWLWSSHALSHHWRLKVISRLKHVYHCMKILFGMLWHQSFTLWVHKHTHQSSMTTIQTFKSCLSSSCWGRWPSNYSWFWHIPTRKVIATSDNLIGNFGVYGKNIRNYTESLGAYHWWSLLINTLLQLHFLFSMDKPLCFRVMKYIGITVTPWNVLEWEYDHFLIQCLSMFHWWKLSEPRFKCTPWPWRWSMRKLKLSYDSYHGNIIGICWEYVGNIIYKHRKTMQKYIYIYIYIIYMLYIYISRQYQTQPIAGSRYV